MWRRHVEQGVGEGVQGFHALREGISPHISRYSPTWKLPEPHPFWALMEASLHWQD